VRGRRRGCWRAERGRPASVDPERMRRQSTPRGPDFKLWRPLSVRPARGRSIPHLAALAHGTEVAVGRQWPRRTDIYQTAAQRPPPARLSPQARIRVGGAGHPPAIRRWRRRTPCVRQEGLSLRLATLSSSPLTPSLAHRHGSRPASEGLAFMASAFPRLVDPSRSIPPPTGSRPREGPRPASSTHIK
jgi:hypothetical protein